MNQFVADQMNGSDGSCRVSWSRGRNLSGVESGHHELDELRYLLVSTGQ